MDVALTAEYVLGELEKHAETLRGFGVKRIGIFGSVARGEAEGGSDLDVLVELERYTFKDYFGLLAFLEDHFSRKVDLVTVTAIRSELEPYIMGDVVYVTGV
ncbi:nucleotidyltransferase family protein [bacterium]|nr:nucleotidyltransferase family protein [bacterium]